MAVEVLAYLRTRLLNWRIVGLCALVAIVAAAGNWPDAPADWRDLLLLTVLPVLQLRLWDDLADLAHDRSHHPERALVKATTLRPFLLLVAMLGVATALLLAATREPWRLATYAALLLGLAAVYHTDGGQAPGRAVRTLLILLKYPFIALIAAPGRPSGPAAIAAVALYLFLCAHDLRDLHLAWRNRPS